MTSLPNIQQFLFQQLAAEPRSALALTTAILSPFNLPDSGDELYITFDGDDDDLFNYGMRTLSRCLPQIYAAAVVEYNRRGSTQDAEHFIERALLAMGLEATLHDLAYGGIPLMALGINIADVDTLKTHDDLIPLLDALGLPLPEDLDNAGYSIDPPDDFYTVIHWLRLSLQPHAKRAGTFYNGLDHTLAWVASTSGNTLIAVDDDGLCGMETLIWDEPDHLQLASEMCIEAQDILNRIRATLDALHNHPDLLTPLRANAQRLHAHFAQKGLDHDPQLDDAAFASLTWPARPTAQRTAPAVA